MTERPHIYDENKDDLLSVLREIRQPVEVAIYGSNNEFNFGCIIRTCHSFLVSKIWAIDMGWYYKKAALTTLKWEKQNIVKCTMEEFRYSTNNRNLVCFERNHELETKDIRGFQYPEKPILCFGSEQTGTPKEFLSNPLIEKVSIPCLGFVNDLNVSVAVGIALYDWTVKNGNRSY